MNSVFVIGSSTTLLFGPHLEQMLRGFYRYSRKGNEPEQLKLALQDLDHPQGAGAGDSSMVLAYLHSLDQSEAFRPDVVLLHVGAHDIRRDIKTGEPQVPLEKYRENVAAIVEWFERWNIDLIWIRNGPLDENVHNTRTSSFRRFEADMDDYNQAAEEILNRHKVPLLDLPGFVRNLGPLEQLFKDHIHCREDVVQLQAAFIAGYLINRQTRAPN